MSDATSNVVTLTIRSDAASIPFEAEVRELNQRVKDIARSIQAFRRYGASINLQFCASDAAALARCATAIAEAAKQQVEHRARQYNLRDARAQQQVEE